MRRLKQQRWKDVIFINCAEKNEPEKTLKHFFDKRAEEAVTDEEKQRVLAKTLEKIRAGEFDKLRRAEDKRIMFRYMLDCLAEKTLAKEIEIIILTETKE